MIFAALLVLVAAAFATRYILSLQPQQESAEIIELQPQPESTGELETSLQYVRDRRDRNRRKLLLRGDIVDLKDVQVICEKGHQHGFDNFVRSGMMSVTPSFLDSRNLANYDPKGDYTGPNVFGREPNEGLGWVPGSFGCPTCDAARFSFAKFEHNEYTACGHHLVRKDQDECPLCAELQRSSKEEAELLRKLQGSHFPQMKAS